MVLIIAVIWAIFQIQNDRFLSAINLTNLTLQIAAVGTISIGVVLVLLLGEIDLSVGAVSGLAAGVMAVLNVKQGWNPELAILAGLATGAAIGLFNGFMVTFFGIPSFVVTLAGLLAWQGALLLVLGDTGTINLPPSTITDLAGKFYDPWVGWTLAVAVTAGTLGSGLLERRRRLKAGLETGPLAGLVIRTVLVGAGIFAADRHPQLRPGDPAGGADPGRPLRDLRLHHHPHPLRPPHLRDRRQRRGGAAGGDPGQPHPRSSSSRSPRPLPRPGGSSPPRG